MSKQEWAVRDEVTGEWWGNGVWVKEPHYTERYDDYVFLAHEGWPFQKGNTAYRETARIVPAPPREMTDAEAFIWLQSQMLVLMGARPGWSVEEISAPMTFGQTVATGNTPCDAIRAARRKLESK